MTGQLFINDLDAYAMWGISLEQTSLSSLMTPAGTKARIKNTSRLEHGSRIVTDAVKMEERELTLTLNLHADTEHDFLNNYAAFCSAVLAHGRFTIRTCWQPDVTYRLEYNDCNQFQQWYRTIAKFSLRCTEIDPTDRDV